MVQFDATRSSSLPDWFHAASGWRDAVLPSYDGGSIANIAASVLVGLGLPIPDQLLPPLSADVLEPELLAGSDTIVLIVLDAYGSAARQRGMHVLGECGSGRFVEQQITSVFPSTTAAALTSLQVGVAPGTHGLAGYTLHIPSANRLMNMVTFKPVDAANSTAELVDLQTFLPIPTLYDVVRHAGAESVVVSHREYRRSPLTMVHSGETPYRGHRTLAEFVHLLRLEALRPSNVKRFIFGYWAGIDMLAHTWGPDSDVCQTEIALVEHALQHEFLKPLASAANNLAVIVTADHGQVSVPDTDALPLHRLVADTGGWSRLPTGERRAVGVGFSCPAQRQRVQDSVASRGVLLDIDEAISHGLYGPPPLHPELRERIGDALLLARDGASFPFRPLKDGAEPSLGAHGSLSALEMEVPLLVWRF